MNKSKCWGICKETDRLEKELEVYDKALKLACKDIAQIDLKFHDIFANDMEYWRNLYLKKAREE